MGRTQDRVDNPRCWSSHRQSRDEQPAGVIEIDDKWEARYGDMEFDSRKFPDPKTMVDELHGWE